MKRLSLGLLLMACSGGEPPPLESASSASSQPIVFAFGTIDGGEVSSDTTRGRVSALLFVTTFDLASQGEARFLAEVASRHTPRVNAAIVMLEPPHSAPLAQVWRDALGLKLSVAMASPGVIEGDSAFGAVPVVPTLIVLDREGRLRVRREGAIAREQIVESLRAAGAR